jgi:hypothetical protein
MRLCFVLVFVFQFFLTSAQETTVTVSGEIMNTEGIKINNCAIKISNPQTKQIYSFVNTKESNTFSEKITRKLNDSILISISHTAYSLYEKKVSVSNGTVNIKAILTEKTNELKMVEVAAPKTWVRGDTTFYKIDAYKEGDEKKLKDILLKLPDFRLDDKGKMLFKNKPLDKVTIDNEEMFADKIDLMLNSFPIHVLNTIQAIENQSKQKLLNGLSGENNTFLNLSIKKDAKIKTAFGDTELGIDNLGRYNFAPVVFSMYGKLKVGFIGNWNKIGNGVSQGLETELKNKYENVAANLLMNNNSLSFINNFENRSYIKNNQWDNRFQLNTKINTRIKSLFQFSYVKDKQEQNTFNNSQLYTNNTYVSRIDSSFNLYRPKIFSAKESIVFSIDSLSELSLIASAYLNQSGGNRQFVFNGLEINSPLDINTQNNWSSYSLIGNYTRRVSERRATAFYLNLNSQKIGQSGTANSNDIGTIFGINPNFQTMGNQIDSKYANITLGWSNLSRAKKGGILNYGILASYTLANLNNLSYFEDSSYNSYDAKSQYGNYSVYNITANLSKSFHFIIKSPFSFGASFGVDQIMATQQNERSDWMNYIGNITLSNKHDFHKKVNGEFRFSLNKNSVEINRLNQFFYPTTLTNYEKYSNPELQPINFSTLYSFAFTPFNDLTRVTFFIVYNRNLRSQINNSTYDRFLQYNVISATSTSTHNINFVSGISYPALWANAVFDFSATYNLGNRLMLYNNDIVKSKFSYSLIGLTFKKNWKKKIYLKINPSLLTQSSKLPIGESNNTVSTFRIDANQRYVISPRINISSNAKLLIQNIGKPSQENFMLLDFEVNYNFKNKPLFLSLRADNLTNQRNYYYYYNSDQLLNFGTIPLIKRNLYFSAKYNF